jgi:hypothetical protein
VKGFRESLRRTSVGFRSSEGDKRSFGEKKEVCNPVMVKLLVSLFGKKGARVGGGGNLC